MIISQAQLEEKIKTWQELSTIFLDTEFIRTQTFYPILALIQIKADGHTFLIDPKTIEDLSCLSPLLTNPNVLKVLHALSEDVEVFLSSLGVIISPVLDTQIAAKWLNIGENIGYAKLIEHGLSISLPKDQTQSDWLQRPLTDSQKQYAADDVIYLEQMFEQLSTSLDKKELTQAVLEDSKRLANNMMPKQNDLYYLKVKRAWKLPVDNQYVLKQLCAWREQTAKDDNVPRTRVFNDVALMNIAQRLPKNKTEVTSVVDAHPKQIRKYAQLAAECVKQQLLIIEGQSHLDDFELIEKPLNVKAQNEFKALKQSINHVAKSLDFYPDCLCNKKHLESFYRKYVLDQTTVNYDESYFSGFRQRYLQPVLLEFLNRE